LAGKRWAVEHEGPLARGAEAERLIERARAWAELHPLHQVCIALELLNPRTADSRATLGNVQHHLR
jgi:hypothetical protein